MTGFKTKNNIYRIDNVNKRITGGFFGDAWVPFVSIQALIGDRARIKLQNGQVVTTSTVQSYI